MAKVDGRFGPLQTLAAAPMRFRLASLVIGWLMIAAPCMAAMPGEPDQQSEVCRRVAMSPEEYRALADEIRRLPPKALRGEDEESHVVALLRERLEQILAGRGDTDQQIAAILGLIHTVEADVGLPTLEPARRDQVLAWLTLGVLAEECGDSRAPSVAFEQADQDACRIGAVSSEAYQAIAAEIAAPPTVDWQEVHEDPFGVSEDLDDVIAAAIRDRIQGVIASRRGSDEQVAAMHAALRSIGAEFTWADLVSFHERPDFRRVKAIVYHYRINVNRLGVLRPLLRWGRIDIVLTTDESWETIGDLRHVAFHIAVPFSPSISGLKKDLPQTRACPPVPAEAERPVRHQEPKQE